MGKESCALHLKRLVGEIALHLRWKNFKKDYSVPTISNRLKRIALHLHGVGRDYPFEHTKTNYIFKWMIYGSVRNLRIDFE